MCRIKLTEDRLNDLMFCLLSKHECNCGYEPNDEDVKEFREVIKQILDDHKFRNNFDELFPWDRVKYAGKIQQLEQENKRLKASITDKEKLIGDLLHDKVELKDDLSNLMEDHGGVHAQRDILNKKLEELGLLNGLLEEQVKTLKFQRDIKNTCLIMLKEKNKKKEIALLDVTQKMRWDELTKVQILKENQNLKQQLEEIKELMRFTPITFKTKVKEILKEKE